MNDNVMFIYRLLGVASYFVIMFSGIAVVIIIGRGIADFFKGKMQTLANWFESQKRDTQQSPGWRYGLITLYICTLMVYFATDTVTADILNFHDLRLKPDGQYCFYVEVQQGSGKTYTLPAQVRVYFFEDKYYYVEKAYFSNGESLTFDCDEHIEIDEPTELSANGRAWKVRLLNEHAYSPYVHETNNAEIDDVLIMLARPIPVLLMLCLCVIPIKGDDRDKYSTDSVLEK